MNVLVSVKSKSDNSSLNVTRSVNGRLLLGRSPDSVVPLDGPGISREHLAIEVEGSTLYVTDVSSVLQGPLLEVTECDIPQKRGAPPKKPAVAPKRKTTAAERTKAWKESGSKLFQGGLSVNAAAAINRTRTRDRFD